MLRAAPMTVSLAASARSEKFKFTGWALLTPSPHGARIGRTRDFPTIRFSHLADAAIVRKRGTCIVATQRVLSTRSFIGVVLAGTKTVLSLHAVQTNETRDLSAINVWACCGASVFCACGMTYAKLQRLLPEQPIKGVMPTGTKTVSSPQKAHALWSQITQAFTALACTFPHGLIF